VPSQQIYAVKMIVLESLSQSSLAQIEKEIEILHKVNHRHIIKLIDFRKTANNWYLIFEFCEHGDLVRYIKNFYQKGLVPEQHVRKILR
jgi:serine/threonine-protein kinase ULK/ATG1